MTNYFKIMQMTRASNYKYPIAKTKLDTFNWPLMLSRANDVTLGTQRTNHDQQF